jgi:hypothetical protein
MSHSNDGKKNGACGGVYCENSMSPLQKKLLEEWLPLELSFGIPLFSDDANHTVCDKVCITCKSCDHNNYYAVGVYCVSL